MCPSRSFWYCFFDLKKGFTFVGHSLNLTFSPRPTRKSLDLIFIIKLSSVSPSVLFMIAAGKLPRRPARPYCPRFVVRSLGITPFPVPDFRQVLAVFPDVLLVLNQLVL